MVSLRWLAPLTAFLLAAPAFAEDETNIVLKPDETLLSIRATGTVLAKPDLMELSAGASAQGKTAIEAVNASNAILAKIVEALKTNKVPLKDVQTSRFELEPYFENEDSYKRSEKGQLLGYEASNKLSVRLRDLSTAGEVISAMYEAGANSVQGPNFGFADPSPHIRRAEKAAIAEARAEAESFADALGMRVGRVLRVYDREVEYETDDNRAIVVTGSRIAPTPVEPGEVEVGVEVQVEFALTPK